MTFVFDTLVYPPRFCDWQRMAILTLKWASGKHSKCPDGLQNVIGATGNQPHTVVAAMNGFQQLRTSITLYAVREMQVDNMISSVQLDTTPATELEQIMAGLDSMLFSRDEWIAAWGDYLRAPKITEPGRATVKMDLEAKARDFGRRCGLCDPDPQPPQAVESAESAASTSGSTRANNVTADVINEPATGPNASAATETAVASTDDVKRKILQMTPGAVLAIDNDTGAVDRCLVPVYSLVKSVPKTYDAQETLFAMELFINRWADGKTSEYTLVHTVLDCLMVGKVSNKQSVFVDIRKLAKTDINKSKDTNPTYHPVWLPYRGRVQFAPTEESKNLCVIDNTSCHFVPTPNPFTGLYPFVV